MALKIKPQSKLNHARVVERLVHSAKRRRAVDILHKNSVTGQTELSVIEKVEKFSAELEIVSLVNAEILKGRKIRVHETRAGKWRTSDGLQAPRAAPVKSTGIEPILIVMHL